MDGDDSSWMDRFLAAFFERRPVDATYVGVPGYDHLLPDLSAAAVAATAEEMRSLLREAEAEPAVSGFAEQTDRRLAQGFLRIQLWELSSRWMIGNPSFVVGEAIFGMMSLLQCLHEPETRADRIASLRSRMLAVPNFLRTAAETHLDASSVPSAWVEKARTECGAALSFLSEGVKCLPEDLSVEAAAAAAGFEAYDSALQYVLEQGAQDFVGCGSVAFERYMEEGHCLAMTGDEIVAHAQRELETARAWKDVPSLGGVTPSLNSLHPSTGQYLNRFGEVWDTIKALVDEKQLLTWPDFPIECMCPVLSVMRMQINPGTQQQCCSSHPVFVCHPLFDVCVCRRRCAYYQQMSRIPTGQGVLSVGCTSCTTELQKSMERPVSTSTYTSFYFSSGTSGYPAAKQAELISSAPGTWSRQLNPQWVNMSARSCSRQIITT